MLIKFWGNVDPPEVLVPSLTLGTFYGTILLYNTGKPQSINHSLCFININHLSLMPVALSKIRS